jgi:ferritin
MIVDPAIAERDHASQIFLRCYVTEQIQEEENDNDIIAKLKLVGTGTENNDGLSMLDKELGERMTTVLTDYSKGIEAGMKAAQKIHLEIGQKNTSSSIVLLSDTLYI